MSLTETGVAINGGKPLTSEESDAISLLRERTDEAVKLKARYGECAQERRDAIVLLRDLGWSYRRIGETIGVSGQRIDSMLRLGAKLAAKGSADEE